jgi:hypothetical protein
MVVLLVGRVSDARNQLKGRSEVARFDRPHQSTIGEPPEGQRGEAAGDLSVGEQGSRRRARMLARAADEQGKRCPHGTKPTRRTLSITIPSTGQ